LRSAEIRLERNKRIYPETCKKERESWRAGEGMKTEMGKKEATLKDSLLDNLFFSGG